MRLNENLIWSTYVALQPDQILLIIEILKLFQIYENWINVLNVYSIRIDKCKHKTWNCKCIVEDRGKQGQNVVPTGGRCVQHSAVWYWHTKTLVVCYYIKPWPFLLHEQIGVWYKTFYPWNGVVVIYRTLDFICWWTLETNANVRVFSVFTSKLS